MLGPFRSVVLLALLAVAGSGAAARAAAPIAGVQDGVLIFDATGDSTEQSDAGFDFAPDDARGPGFRTTRPVPADRLGPGCFTGTDDQGIALPDAFFPPAGPRAVLVKGPPPGPFDRLAPTGLVLRDSTSAGAGPQPPIPMRIDAGAGNDPISVRDAAREEVSCGPGLDEVSADSADIV